VNLIVSGKVLSTIFPLPYALSVTIGGGIILTYLLLAGFKAVVRTDVFQLLIAIVMSVSVALFLLGKTSIPVSELRLFGNMDAGTMIGFIVIGIFSLMVQPDLWQRMFAARDLPTMKRGLTYAGFILLLLAFTISVVGLATKQFFPSIVPEDALVTGFSNLLPRGLRELGMVLLYAVCLSSSDTVTFVVSSIFTRDLQNYTQHFRGASMRQMTRLFVVLFILLAVAVGIFYQDIIALGLSLSGLGLALFPPTFGSLFWKLSDRAVAWSIGLAMMSVMLLFITGLLKPGSVVIALPVSLFSLIVFQGISQWRGKPMPFSGE
jgi:SSS family solute:Na+ symporter